MIYTALAFIWVIYISFIISIISLTYRCVVEMVDEVTGFTDTGNGLVWLSSCFFVSGRRSRWRLRNIHIHGGITCNTESWEIHRRRLTIAIIAELLGADCRAIIRLSSCLQGRKAHSPPTTISISSSGPGATHRPAA